MLVTRRGFIGANLLMAQTPDTRRDDWQGIARIVAVGDVHGDKDALTAVLKMAGVVDEQERWTGGDTHVVQIGDIPARGTQVRRTFDFLMCLQTEAAAAGGRVHALIGNHDAGTIYGDLRGTLPEEYGEFRRSNSQERLELAYAKELDARKKAGRLPDSQSEIEYLRKSWFESHPPGFVEHREAFGPSGNYGSWIRTNNAILRINDTLFLHGGISSKYARHTRRQINATIRRELSDPVRLLPGMATDIQGPLWYRGLAEDEGSAIQSTLAAVLRFHQVRRVVIGHTVTRTAILPRFGGRVINIDIGLSRFYGRPPACLVMETGCGYVLHRGVKVALPGAESNGFLKYLRAVEAADEQPSPLPALIRKLEAAQ